MKNFVIRDATKADATFIAAVVLEAMGHDAFSCLPAEKPGQKSAAEKAGRQGEGQNAEAILPPQSEGQVMTKKGERAKELDQDQGDMPSISRMAASCEREDTLYSYANTRIACVDGQAAGALVSYPGDGYTAVRDLTWSSIMGFEFNPEELKVDLECQEGEYYLDSMAILPRFRKLVFEDEGATDKIGHLLMLDGIRKGRSLGYKRISLIVAVSHPKLIEYYGALGFQAAEEITFFDEPYLRMTKEI